MLLTALSGFFILLTTILGVLVTIFPDWLGPTGRWWVVGAFVVICGASIAVDVGKYVAESKDSERLEAEITGRGGWSYVSILGIQPAAVVNGEIVERPLPDGSEIALFQLLNPSGTSVFKVRVGIMQQVRPGQGFAGTQAVSLGGYETDEVHPHDAPTQLARHAVLRKGQTHIFDFDIRTRTASFYQRSIVVWKDDFWHSDYELKQHADADRGNEEKVLHEMAPEFKQLLEATLTDWYPQRVSPGTP